MKCRDTAMLCNFYTRQFFIQKGLAFLLSLEKSPSKKKEEIMANIIKKENAQPATLGSAVDQLFHQNLSRWFDDDFWGFNGLKNIASVPMNVRETDKTYELELVAPGLDKKDFNLSFSGDTLTVSFEHKEESKQQSEQENRWLRREYRHQSFTRSFRVDETIDMDKVIAKYDNGILHLTLPKKEQAQKISKTINVQ